MMANLTIVVEDEVLKRARLRAIEQGTSVNALLRDYLDAYSGASATQREAVRDLVTRSRKATSGRGGNRWTRDDLHER